MPKKNLSLLPQGGRLGDEQIKWFSEQVRKMDDMNSEEFEIFLEQLFIADGYKVSDQARLQPTTSDGGKDMIIKKKGVTTVIEAKAWRLEHKHNVGVSIVEKLAGVIVGLKKPKYRGAVITTNFFTPPAKRYAQNVPHIELIDRNGLLRLIASIEPRIITEVAFHELSKHMGYCPECNHVLVKKQNSIDKSYFLACPTNEKHPPGGCGYTEDIPKNGQIDTKNTQRKSTHMGEVASCP
ncbi:MAG: restriction endonuclease [Defluviitaleaceae bacterium]|nr:restriction endonuclease [Defluviitaleaceae bacterium]